METKTPFTFTSECVTQVVFRADVDDTQCTWLADTDGHHEVLPTKVDSQTIVIDGTDPVPTIAADPASWFNQTVQTSVMLTFLATGNLSGIAGYELSIDSGAWFAATIVGFNPSMMSFTSADDGVAPWDMLIWADGDNIFGTLLTSFLLGFLAS